MENATNEYGLIGFPLGHSFSKKYFDQKFEEEVLLHCKFHTFPLEDIEAFPALIQEHPNLRGLSVTIPYKEKVLAFVDEQSPEVQAIGATNSIQIKAGKLTAYNTDIIGFEHSFKEKLNSSHKKAIILGTGGASKAVQYILDKLAIPYLIVTRQRTNSTNQINYTDLSSDLFEQHEIIINTTPVGMYPNVDACPDIPYESLTNKHYLYDLVYKPDQTMFLQRGERNGATVKNGFDMLLLQAEASWKIWNG